MREPVSSTPARIVVYGVTGSGKSVLAERISTVLKVPWYSFGRERPARFTFFIHEFVLRLPVGGPAVLVEQLQHLLRKSTRPYLTLRVVPAARGGHAAINADDESLRIRERLAAADLLAPTGPPRPRPAEEDLAHARRRAGQGHSLADLVRDGRE
ncbi:MAG: Scr1 family TA system antitoxin-like transcriptional regulator [Pseudonocardiaceae bacterium]